MQELGIAVLIVFAGLVIFMLGYNKAIPIESDKPITPELRIEIKNNVADTTYIYKKL